MKEKLLSLIKDRDNKCKIVNRQLTDIRNNFNKEIKEILPFKDEFIKVNNEFGPPIYMFVKEVFYADGDICLSGFGFSFIFDNKTTYLNLDDIIQHNISIYDNKQLAEELNSIQIISKEEFKQQFNKIINELTKINYGL